MNTYKRKKEGSINCQRRYRIAKKEGFSFKKEGFSSLTKKEGRKKKETKKKEEVPPGKRAQ